MPVSERGCDCGNVCKHPGCALFGAGGICGKHGIYDGMRCPKCYPPKDTRHA